MTSERLPGGPYAGDITPTEPGLWAEQNGHGRHTGCNRSGPGTTR